MTGQSKNDRSVMEPMLNLSCGDGHRWFSPNPDHWVNRQCLAALRESGVRKCERLLKKLER